MRRSINYFILILSILASGFGCSGGGDSAVKLTQPTETPPSPPPTAEPTFEQDYRAPVFVPGLYQILPPSSEVIEIDLSGYVYGIDPQSDVITWTAESSDDLAISMDGPRLLVRRASAGWSGIQTVRVEACSPGNLCGQVDIELGLIGKVENGMMHTQMSGVIIEIGGEKVIIDALFILPSGTGPMMEEVMSAAAPPYDGADLILATHHHWDHFDPGIVVSYLIHTPTARFVSTDIAVTLMAQQAGFDQIADRVTGIHLERGESTKLTISGINLEIMFLSHGDDQNVPNFGYLFSIGGQTFFHTGDIVMEDEPVETLLGYGLPNKGIDYAFVPYFWLTNEAYFPFALEGTNARHLVPIHIDTAAKQLGSIFETMESNFGNAISFRQDYSWYPFE